MKSPDSKYLIDAPAFSEHHGREWPTNKTTDIYLSAIDLQRSPFNTICGCFRGVWKLPAGCRSVVDAAVNSEPLHSGTRGIDRRDCVRAIERRRLRHVGWPGFSPNGAIDSRTNGCAGYVSQV